MKLSILDELERKPRNLISLLALGSLGLNVLVLLILLWQQLAIVTLSRKPPSIYIETVDGRTIKADAMPNKYRDPKIVKQFAETTMTMLVSASIEIPLENGKTVKDKGVEVANGNGKVTQATWSAAFAVAKDFRKQLLEQIAPMQSGVFSGDTQLVLEISQTSDPQEVKEANTASHGEASGKWTVDMVASVNVLRIGANNRYTVVEEIPFNQRIFIRATPFPVTSEVATPLQKAVAAMRSSGLEIYFARDLDIDKFGKPSNDADFKRN